MTRKKKTESQAVPRRTPPETFPAFVAAVEQELSGRIGGTGAADFVARDPSFGNIFRLTFDIRNAVGNPVKKCAGLIVDALASAIVRQRMDALAGGAEYAPTQVPAAKVGRSGDLETGIPGIVIRTEPVLADEPGIAGTVVQLAGELAAPLPAQSDEINFMSALDAPAADATPRRRSARSAGSKTGGEPSVESLSLPTARDDERASDGSGPIDVG